MITLILKLKLDIKISLFTFSKDWFYLLSGRKILSDDDSNSLDDIDFIYCEVIISKSERLIKYTGILDEFYLSRTKGLESILLFDANMDNDFFTNKTENQKPLLGKYCSIRCDDIVNININYYNIKKLEE